MGNSEAKAAVAARVVSIGLTGPQAVPRTSAQVWEPSRSARAVVVLAHGAGSTRTAPILLAVADALATVSCAVVAFNFGYAELGRRAPDPMPRLLSAFRDVIVFAQDLAPAAPVVLGGRSMGGRVGTMVVAEGVECAGLLLLGYPLHPPGRRDRLRVDHWPGITVPSLFVSGTRDTFFSLDLFAEHRVTIPGAVTLRLLEGADHGFHVRKVDGRTDADVRAEVCDLSVRWVRQLADAK